MGSLRPQHQRLCQAQQQVSFSPLYNVLILLRTFFCECLLLLIPISTRQFQP